MSPLALTIPFVFLSIASWLVACWALRVAKRAEVDASNAKRLLDGFFLLAVASAKGRELDVVLDQAGEEHPAPEARRA